MAVGCIELSSLEHSPARGSQQTACIGHLCRLHCVSSYMLTGFLVCTWLCKRVPRLWHVLQYRHDAYRVSCTGETPVDSIWSGLHECTLRLHQLLSPAAVPRGCGQGSTEHAWEGIASACSGPVTYSSLQGPLDLGRVTKWRNCSGWPSAFRYATEAWDEGGMLHSRMKLACWCADAVCNSIGRPSCS